MPTPIQKGNQADKIRAERDRRIQEIEWRIKRYESEKRQGLTPTDDIGQLDIFVQALRDITDQPNFPDSVEWPTEP